jgi:hypothetical protein
MHQKLTEYLEMVRRYEATPREASSSRPKGALYADLLQREGAVKAILRTLEPGLEAFDIEMLGGVASARNAALRGLGRIKDHDEVTANLDASVVTAS